MSFPVFLITAMMISTAKTCSKLLPYLYIFTPLKVILSHLKIQILSFIKIGLHDFTISRFHFYYRMNLLYFTINFIMKGIVVKSLDYEIVGYLARLSHPEF